MSPPSHNSCLACQTAGAVGEQRDVGGQRLSIRLRPPRHGRSTLLVHAHITRPSRLAILAGMPRHRATSHTAPNCFSRKPQQIWRRALTGQQIARLRRHTAGTDPPPGRLYCKTCTCARYSPTAVPRNAGLYDVLVVMQRRRRCDARQGSITDHRRPEQRPFSGRCVYILWDTPGSDRATVGSRYRVLGSCHSSLVEVQSGEDTSSATRSKSQVQAYRFTWYPITRVSNSIFIANQTKQWRFIPHRIRGVVQISGIALSFLALCDDDAVRLTRLIAWYLRRAVGRDWKQ